MRYQSLAHLLLENSKLGETKGIHYFQNEKNTKYSSYNELFHNARRILNYLAGKGIKEGQELVLQIDDISTFVEVFWACILGKIIPVPVTTSINDEIRFKLLNIWGLLNDPWMCISKSLLDNLEILSNKMDHAEIYNQIKQRSILVDNIYDSEKEAEIKEPSDGDIAFIQFSSGSTGDPRGVIMTHRNLLINVEDIVTGCRADKEEVSVSWMPLTHDMGLIGCHFVSVFSGWNHCLINPIAFVRNPFVWLEKIQEYKATMTASPNFGFRHLIKSFKPERHKNLDLSSVKLIFNGAEPISVSLCKDFLDAFESFGLKRNVIFTVYGLAEAGLAVSFPIPGKAITAYTIDRNNIEIGKRVIFLDPQENGVSFVSEGKPLTHCRVQITDNDNQPLADDISGNICIKGDNVTSGYYNDETQTKKIIDALGWLHTGDIGFIHDGSLVITGRAKEIIFVNGQNYFPHDLERIIHEMDVIQEGKLAVTSINTENNSTDEILCFVVHKKGLDDFIELRSSINQWMLSKAGVTIHRFIPVDKIPKTSSGKIQRIQLRDAYGRGEYDSILLQISEIAEKQEPGSNEPAGSEIEKKIIHIVRDVLKTKDDEIGIDENFFDMGITSLSLIQIKSKIESEINRKIDDVTLFEHSTIRKLAAYIANVNHNKVKPVNVTVSSREEGTHTEIAVIGMSCKFPGANSIDRFWDNLKNGVESISFFSNEELIEAGCSVGEILANNYVKAKGIIDADRYFDSHFFEYTPRETGIIDPQMLVFLQCAWEALEDGSVNPELYEGKVGVFSGGSPNLEWQNHVLRTGRNTISEKFKMFQLINKDFMSAWVSYKFNLKGPSVNIYSACSTSLVAVGMAASSLLHHECDIALAGGVSIHLPEISGYEYQEGMILSKDGHVRTYDREASGTVFSDGAGVVALKRLSDAVRDKNHIYAVLLGADINNDGNEKVAFTAPGKQGQAEVIRNTIARAGVEPSTISYIENHGASTLLGDPIEIEALKSVFDNTGNKYCGLGSVKTNIGHLDVAAGIAGFIKTALMLKHKQIPPSLNFTSLNPKIDLDNTPFYIVDKLIDWKTSGFPLRAGVSSFGIGGTNAHVILQESPPMPPAKKERDGELICLSAKTEAALDEYKRKLESYVNAHPHIDCGDLAYTLNKGRKTFSKRAMLILKKQESLKAALSEQGRITYSNFLKNETRQIIFVFHGEYSRQIDVGLKLFENFDYFRREIEICSDKIKSILGKDIGSIFSQAPDTALDKGIAGIEISPLSMFIIEYAIAQLLIRWGIKPSGMIGSNIGEYAAACIAGSIDFETAVKIISFSAELERKNISSDSEFNEYLDQFNFHDPKIPCYSESMGYWINSEKIKESFHRADLKNQHTQHPDYLSVFDGKEPRILVGIGRGKVLAATTDVNALRAAGTVAFDLLPNQMDEVGACDLFLEGIGRIWLAGIDINWGAYYEGREKNYLSLPGYAFEPVVRNEGFITNTELRHKEKESGKTWEKSAGGKNRLHPLLHQNTSDLEEHRYTTVFSGKEFFLQDHVIQGVNILPAVAYAEMARAAIEKSVQLENRTLRFENIVWAQPFIFCAETKGLIISLHREENNRIAFKIYGNGTSQEKEKVYSQGRAITEGALQGDERLDIAKMKEECNKKIMTGKECYEAFAELGVSYGAGHRTIRDLYIGVNQVVAKLEKNGTSAEDNDGYILHPGMMDGALQAVIGFLKAEEIKKPGLPFALESMDVLSGCTESMWSIVKYSAGHNAESKIKKYDIDICDESGVVCVKIKGFSTRVLEGNLSNTYIGNLSQERAATSSETDLSELSGALSLMPVWKPVQANAIERLPRAGNKIAVIGGTPEQKKALKNLYSEMKMLHFRAKDGIDEIASKLNEIDALDHIFWFGPAYERTSVIEEKSIHDLKIVKDQEKGVMQVFRLIKALLKSGYGTKSLGWTVITIQTQAVNNKEEIDPAHAGIHGLMGSLAKEYPNWQIRLVDLPSCDASSMEEMVTLSNDRNGNAVAYRNGQWYKQELVSIRDIGTEKDLYKVNGVYVVIGGAGGVGQVWSKWMIEKYGAKIVWLGRRAENDDIQAKISELGRLGPTPVYISADATDLGSLKKAYEKIKDMYPEINGVIHSAIVLHDQSLANMGEKVFSAVLEAKVNVSVNLSIVFEKEDLDFVLFFSSIQSFVKAAGQGNYAAGCTFNDAYGYWLNRKLSCSVKVMNWGYWGSVGVASTEEYRERMAQLGVGSIEPEEGMPILDKFMSSAIHQMLFVKITGPLAMGDGVFGQAFSKATSDIKKPKEIRPMIRKDINTPYMAPRSIIEKDLVRLWEYSFGYDRIGINDNFFTIGGDSLLMTILLNKIHEHFNVEIPIDDFFNSPTIAGLANMFDISKNEEFAYIKPIGQKDFYSTSPAQKRIYLAQSVDRKSTSYNITTVWHLEGEVNMTKLSEAVKKLVARHDSLRTSFEILNGNIVQRISDSVMFEIDYIETKKENLESEIDSRVIPFDLTKAPLLRVTMMKIGENNHIIVADMHHSIADATSGGLMIKEVMQIYSGKELKPLKIQYKDYTEWLSQRMASDEIKKQYDYWLGRMKTGISTLNLITDYERPAKQTFTGNTVETILDSEIANALAEICRKYNATIYMVFYALVSVLLSKYTGQTDILMGSPVSGRDHADLENVVGMFVNMLLMRSFPSPDKTFLHFLTEVRNDTLQGFKNKECQFDELSTQLHYQRDIRRNPIYDVVFAVMNMNIPDLAIPGVKVRPYEEYKNKTCKTDLRFGITEKEKKIIVNVTYNVDLFKMESIVKMSSHLVEIIKTVIRDIHVKLEDIKLLAIPVAAKSGKEHSREIEFDF